MDAVLTASGSLIPVATRSLSAAWPTATSCTTSSGRGRPAHQIPGWITAPDVLAAIGRQITTAQPQPHSPDRHWTRTAARAHARRPRCPDTSSPRSPSPPAHPPPGQTRRLTWPAPTPRYQSCATAGSARPTRSSPWAPGDRVSLLAAAPAPHPDTAPPANTMPGPPAGKPATMSDRTNHGPFGRILFRTDRGRAACRRNARGLHGVPGHTAR